MRQRRFHEGEAFVVGNVRFRVVKGAKGPDDLRLDWDVNGRWEAVSLDPVFLIIDMVCENEDFLFPFPQKGGLYTEQAIRDSRIRGWRYAVEKLHRERAKAEARREELEGDAA